LRHEYYQGCYEPGRYLQPSAKKKYAKRLNRKLKKLYNFVAELDEL